MPNPTTPKRLPLILLLLLTLCAAPVTLCAEKAGARSRFSTPRHAALAVNDREQDGLVGPVRRVKTETAKISVKNGKPVEGARALLETITYDNRGARVDSAYFLTAGGSLTGKEIYKYDERGNMVEMTLHDADGSLLAKETYIYEFDAVGNWVKMTTAVGVVEGGKLTFEPTEVTYRTIAYFLEEKTATRLAQAQAAPAPAQAVPAPAQAAPAQAAATQPASFKPAAPQPASSQPTASQAAPSQSAPSRPTSPAEAAQQAALKTSLKPADVAAGRPAEKAPVEKAAEKPAEKPAEKAPEKAVDKVAEKASDGGASAPNQVAAVSPDRGGAAAVRQPAPAAAGAGQPNQPAGSVAKPETSAKSETSEPAANAKSEKSEAAAKPEPVLKPEGEAAARPVVRGPLKPVSGGILNGKALSLPPPQYPDMARRAGVSGLVEVEVVIDVSGKVISAKASKGPAMLQPAAEMAARQAKFVPTLLSGQPVKVSGVITYNFSMR